MISPKRIPIFIALLLLILIASVFAAICIGRYTISIYELFAQLSFSGGSDPLAKTVVWDIRFPRVLTALTVGAGLSVAGLALQAMFSNPLVDTQILGVSSAAGFGAALGILLFDSTLLTQITAVIFGFIGMAATYWMSKKENSNPILMLVLSGIIVGAIFQALISLTKFVADPDQQLPAITYWLMGSLAGAHTESFLRSLPLYVLGIGIIWFIRWHLNVLSLPEDEAVSMGVNVKLIRGLIIVSSTILAAVSVSLCGMISFVGLAIPHFCRMLVGSNHKTLVPVCIIVGAIFLLAIDVTARTVTEAEIPLSVLTALIGAPFFAILLKKTGGIW